MYAWSQLCAGGALQAARLVTSGEVDVAFHIAGGLHHGMPEHASGFCYVNDLAIAITALVQQGYRVAYIDVDVHHGDGVQAAFYDTDQVLTISLHESGRFCFLGQVCRRSWCWQRPGLCGESAVSSWHGRYVVQRRLYGRCAAVG